MSITEDLFTISRKLSNCSKRLKEREFFEVLDRLADSAQEIGKAWSGSWLGYHSRVYYEGFSEPPPGARFSQEWGFMDTFSTIETRGEWREYRFDDVIEAIRQKADYPDLSKQEEESREARNYFEEGQSLILSCLSSAIETRPNDKFISDLREKAEKEKILDAGDFIKYYTPSGQLMTRDRIAGEKGLTTPPHLSVIANIDSIRQPFIAIGELAKIAHRAASHLLKVEPKVERERRIGTNVFIGHGSSNVWRDLKDFIQDRLHLPWDEFNRVPVAGVPNTERLSQMLDDAAIAFLVMTAEDEQADGKMHARMNLIHEAGLFQGRLGFEKAIILLEEGCEEFSNIQGLGQIRFPAANISHVFEDIRRVLEREGLIES